MQTDEPATLGTDAELNGTFSVRRGRPADSEACHRVLWHAVTDLASRHGAPLEGTADDWWAGSEPQFRYLARAAAEWWVAQATDGELIGYGRSIERGGLFELTEFFVRPGQQSRGVGNALLARAFPVGRGDVRSIIATTDVRAIARYYRADTVARFAILTLAGPPAAATPDADLEPIQLDSGSDALTDVLEMERSVLGYDRGHEEVRWLLETRQGYLYRRGGRKVGFGFIGRDGSGPIATLDPADLPEVLLHVEGRARDLGSDRLSLEVPSPNAVAVRHLLSRGYRLDPWINLLMANRPFGQFDRFICFSPPLFL